MAANGIEIMNRQMALQGARGPHEPMWERMAPFFAPSRVGIVGGGAIGERQTKGVYDSTSLVAGELHAQFLAGHIINPAQYWFEWLMRDPRSSVVDEHREWLEECRDIALRNYNASPFYAEGPESLIDTSGFGTGCIIGEENPQPANRHISGFRGMNWTAVKTGRFWIAEGPDGRVDTLHRRFKQTTRNINDRWGRDNNLPEIIKNAIVKKEWERPFNIIHAIYPRPRVELNSYVSKGFAWASCWVEEESKGIINESGYRKFPAACPRYYKTPDDVYGRGRGHLAFPDTFSLNAAKRMGFEDWALKIRPPIMHAHDSVFGTLQLVPGGPTPVNTHGRPIRDALMPFESGGRPEVSQIKEEELRKSIRTIFYVEQILALLEVNKSEMTAFEFARKIELVFKLLGPVYGRLQWEWLYSILDISWDMLWEARAFPPPPQSIYDYPGDIDVDLNNPLAKAQKSSDAEALMFVMNDLGPMAQQKPEMLDWIDPDETAKGIMGTRGFPAKWTRSEEQVERLRAARQEQNQEQIALDKAEQAGSAVGKAAPALKLMQGGKNASPFEQVMNAG